jgi:hypothetical protein
VATEAIAGDARVVKIRRSPRNRRVAVVAGVATRNVCRVLTGRYDAVVAAVAGSNDLGVIHREDRCEDVRRVAVLADVAGLDMCKILARGIHTVVAVDAIAGDVQVIEIGRQPTTGGMAVVAGVAAIDVIQGLAGCGHTIVATRTGADDLCVIDGIGRCEYIGIVAILAHVAGLNVRRVFADRIDSIMAVEAIIGDVRMIEVCRQPANRGMTIVAVVSTLNMGLVLPGRRCAIVTGAAGTQHLGVVDSESRCPNVWCVAVLAHIRRRDM